MGIKVLVNSNPRDRISINSQNRTTVRTIALAPKNIGKLSDLTDIDASDPDNNETLVYDAATGKYVVKKLPEVDGGIF